MSGASFVRYVAEASDRDNKTPSPSTKQSASQIETFQLFYGALATSGAGAPPAPPAPRPRSRASRHVPPNPGSRCLM
ncbi:hypothetical protein EVAR_75950_1 [Eumeta japonica]|uniref:Uncharacterized protein n=1 Tax=Eumeta variegata TaxID=151549 RepID=A0A4C1UXJ4_EUMVA|nr:hypothetical protein EVAR_75950_1 [Eumeta japonica]